MHQHKIHLVSLHSFPGCRWFSPTLSALSSLPHASPLSDCYSERSLLPFLVYSPISKFSNGCFSSMIPEHSLCILSTTYYSLPCFHEFLVGCLLRSLCVTVSVSWSFVPCIIISPVPHPRPARFRVEKKGHLWGPYALIKVIGPEKRSRPY